MKAEPQNSQDLICTRHLIAAFYQICDAMCTVSSTRTVLALSRILSQGVRALLLAQNHNLRLKLKTRMLATPHWRERVLKELGGAVHIARWRRRYLAQSDHSAKSARRARRVFTAKASKAHKVATYTPPHPRICADRVRMDFEGQFRLAPIARSCAKTKRRQSVRNQAQGHRAIGTALKSARPICLFPSDLTLGAQQKRPQFASDSSQSDIRAPQPYPNAYFTPYPP